MDDREFKSLLFERFSKAGFEKEIRANVADKMLQEVKATGGSLNSQPTKKLPTPQDLRHQVLVSIVADFLDKKKCFSAKNMVEAEFKDTPLLPSDQLLTLFDHVPAVSVEVQAGSKLFVHRQPLSVLERLVGHSSYQRTIGKLTRATQTETDESYLLHKRITALDDNFAKQATATATSTAHASVADLQKMLREEHEATLRREMLAFKTNEMRQYRVSVDLEADRKLRDRELAMEKAWAARLADVQEREKTMYRAVEKRAADLELEVHETRRKQLLAIAEIETREKELKREREIRLADIEAREFKLTEREKMLGVKERDIDDLKAELTFNNLQVERRMQVD